jgi:hypothetical protein
MAFVSNRKEVILKKLLLAVGLFMAVAGAGTGIVLQQHKDHDTPQPTSNSTQQLSFDAIHISLDGKLVTYDGVGGQTALDTLKRLTTVQTTKSSFGEYVTTINNLPASATQFWAFYVNGQMATVGAGSYNAVDGDKIEWKLENL